MIAPAANLERGERDASLDDIRLAAYLKWEAAGKPESDGVKFWSEAEQALRSAKE